MSSKRGASGELMFVTLRHEIASGSALALIEEQDIVFCEPLPSGQALRTRAAAAESSSAADASVSRRSATLGAVELFRFLP